MLPTKVLVSQLGICALALFPASAKMSPPGNRYRSELEPYIQKFVKTQEIPGLAIAVVQDGKVVYEHGFGIKTVNPKVVPTAFPAGTKTGGRVNRDTLFHLASVTKTFVAIAVMQLVESGRVRLDDPVIQYLPDFKLDDERYRAITVRQLLNHTSGLPDRNGINGHGWEHPETDDQALRRFVNSLSTEKLKFDPGTKYAYSNVGYEVLGELVSRVSGQTIEAYLQTRVLEPLGMRDSSMMFGDLKRSSLATGHATDDAENPFAFSIYPFNRAQTASGGMISCLKDMERYMIANLNKGELNGVRILSPETYRTMWKPDVKTGADGSLSDYGAGWYVGAFEGTSIVSHPGKDTGFLSYMALLPEKKIGVVWMMNGMWGNGVFSLSDAAMDIALGLPMRTGDVRRDLPAVLADDLEGGKNIEWAMRKYHDLKQRKASNFNFEENRLDLLGDYLVQRGRLKDAIEVYRVNAEAFPGSAHAKKKLDDARAKAQ